MRAASVYRIALLAAAVWLGLLWPAQAEAIQRDNTNFNIDNYTATPDRTAVAAAARFAGARRPGQPTHGRDPDSLDRLPELPPPAGGPAGRPLSSRKQAAAEDVRLSLPTAWCGDRHSTDDGEHETAPGAPKYHAIYALPSDGLDRFPLIASQLQVDALQASALLERLYGRAIRFDMGTSCGPQFLDISVVRLASSTAELAALAEQPGDELFTRVLSDLRAAGFPLLPERTNSTEAADFSKNMLVWLDGPAPPFVCGQATVYEDPTRAASNWNDYGGKLSLVFRDGPGFCNSNTVRHEIGHNLGALQPGAPNAPDGAHCDDAFEDTMCLDEAPVRASGDYNALFFDYGNDDYWDPPRGQPLSRWTVNLSRFLCPEASCNVPGGSGSGGFLDTDGDSVPDSLDDCPTTPGTECDAVADRAQREPAYVRVRIRKARVPGRRSRFTIHATGRGRALLRIRCGSRTVRSRTVRLPSTVRLKLRCGSRVAVAARVLRTDGGPR